MNIWGDVPTWIGVIAGAITLIVGVREYLIAQRWKRSEFLAAEVDRFFANPGIQTALLLIDYSRIALEPDGRRTTVRTPVTQTFDDDLMTRALAVHTKFVDETEKFNAQEMLARMAFDEILTGFERFQNHIEGGLINASDVKVYLGYWVEKFVDPASKWKPVTFYTAVAEFVDAYQYRGAATLFATFGHRSHASVAGAGRDEKI